VTRRPRQPLIVPVTLYRYRLIDAEGNDLGPFVSSDGDVRAGRSIPNGVSKNWHVSAVVAPEQDHAFRAYLVVVPDTVP
jgi:hypothetical protein